MSRRRSIITVSIILLLALIGAGMVVGSYCVIHQAADGRVVTDAALLPTNDVGLVLGTSQFLSGHRRNAHFDHRIETAAELYRTGRVRHLLVSGDNGSRGYDEPADMKTALLARGVPEGAMTLDAAGFRTLDSVARARAVFGQRKLTIITDRFHCDRAVFLARHYGIDATAYPSQDVALRSSMKSRLRECLADVKACLDLWVFHTRPRFLGARIPVRIAGR